MRSIFAIGIVFALITGSVFAGGPKNVVSLQPLGLAIGLANVEYERAFAPKASFAVRGDAIYLRSGDFRLSGYGGGGSLRFYPLTSAPKRAYAGLDFDIIQVNAKEEDTEEEGSATFFAIGAVIGWKWLISDAFAIALDIGTMYFAGSLEVEEEDVGLAGLRPMSHFYIGLAF